MQDAEAVVLGVDEISRRFDTCELPDLLFGM
jgi:hypothetical protein